MADDVYPGTPGWADDGPRRALVGKHDPDRRVLSRRPLGDRHRPAQTTVAGSTSRSGRVASTMPRPSARCSGRSVRSGSGRTTACTAGSSTSSRSRRTPHDHGPGKRLRVSVDVDVIVSSDPRRLAQDLSRRAHAALADCPSWRVHEVGVMNVSAGTMVARWADDGRRVRPGRRRNRRGDSRDRLRRLAPPRHPTTIPARSAARPRVVRHGARRRVPRRLPHRHGSDESHQTRHLPRLRPAVHLGVVHPNQLGLFEEDVA